MYTDNSASLCTYSVSHLARGANPGDGSGDGCDRMYAKATGDQDQDHDIHWRAKREA